MHPSKYVGRAGNKLEFALTHFPLDVKNLVCADLGCNIGGFTHCLLTHGAKKVYAVDTGYGFLDWQLRNDPRVAVMERTNALFLKLPELVDLVTIDVGWTKQEKILPAALTLLKPGGTIITLIKPHYEADKHLLKQGLLPLAYQQPTLNKVTASLAQLPLSIDEIITSPLTGTKGDNVEYLALITKQCN
ncbi:hypothetical protein A2368_01480 [Candidatus Collierbacteria bacterium RIFOXYB1_FULL_49_13]|uniref:Ribosomal RNA methyltransferase FtsJ domain-containing protein n=1 Tax=Candidatus Collierbacteria bacterium RIFOXYB1_FULL_49_13 TaxID=1817728 RepID=A0A1F5FF32_9BACT|nr:MAG: hypothetical protein A2368_01480 [Candidatus Collierbacteria bacterium RIFOXYB1_FULL_49_13]